MYGSGDLSDRDSSTGSTPVIRKFINSAIYVEKPLSTSVSSENTSVSQKYSNDDLTEVQNVKTKRCTCSVDQKTCPCHGDSQSCTYLESHNKRSTAILRVPESKTKLSQSYSLDSADNQKEIQYRNWLRKKEEEKKKRELKEKLLQEVKTKEREALLAQERENFKTWLMNKKKAEMEAKKKKQQELEELQLRELEKEKRQLENQLNFQLWLKKKEEAHLEKRIKEQMQLIGELERKERQLRENEKAFTDWMKTSKNRQKPQPLNKGLQTLCSSTSVTYVNPNPWNPAA